MKISPEKARELKTRLQNSAMVRKGYALPKAYGQCGADIKNEIVHALERGETEEIKCLRALHNYPPIDMTGARDIQAAHARYQRSKVPRWKQHKG